MMRLKRRLGNTGIASLIALLPIGLAWGPASQPSPDAADEARVILAGMGELGGIVAGQWPWRPITNDW